MPMITGYQAVYDADFQDAILYAASNGFDYVSFDLNVPRFYIDELDDGTLHRIRDQAESAGVGLAFHAPGDNISLYADYPAICRGILEHFTSIIRAAEKLGARHVTIHPGICPSLKQANRREDDFAEYYRDYFQTVLYDSISYLASQTQDVLLCIGNANFTPMTMAAVGRLLADNGSLFLTWDIAKTYDLELRTHMISSGASAHITDWIITQLKRAGICGPLHIEQVRNWERSCVLRATDESQSFYFKATPSRLGHEVMLSKFLAERFPSDSIGMIATDELNHWMLMEEYEGTLLRHVSDPGRWEDALSRYAQIQIGSLSFMDQLSAAGCPDFTPERMGSYLDELMDDTEAMLPGRPAGLSDDELGTLRSLLPSIRSLLDELSEFHVPSTLSHGDFWAGNVVCSEGRTIFFDWSDSTITHPFFDLIFFLGVETLPVQEREQNALRDAYLAPWEAYEYPDRLVTLFGHARRLGWIHKVLIEHRLVLRDAEGSARWEIENALPYYLKMALSEWSHGV